jgi:predicted DNA-binding transcriptional regulator AlpA
VAFDFIKPLIAGNAVLAKPKKAKPVKKAAYDLTQPGRLRAAAVIQILGISRTTFYRRVREGQFPAASGKDNGVVYWDTAVVRAFLEK